jgi:hypothetical protein
MKLNVFSRGGVVTAFASGLDDWPDRLDPAQHKLRTYPASRRQPRAVGLARARTARRTWAAPRPVSDSSGIP